MTKSERIAALEAKVAALETIVAGLQYRSYPYQPYWTGPVIVGDQPVIHPTITWGTTTSGTEVRQ